MGPLQTNNKVDKMQRDRLVQTDAAAAAAAAAAALSARQSNTMTWLPTYCAVRTLVEPNTARDCLAGIL
jgi:hypothetical protein